MHPYHSHNALDTFVDKRMKIKYMLSLMHGGIACVWAENKTSAVLSHTSMFSTLWDYWPALKGWLCAQLHALKMMTGMTEDE